MLTKILDDFWIDVNDISVTYRHCDEIKIRLKNDKTEIALINPVDISAFKYVLENHYKDK